MVALKTAILSDNMVDMTDFAYVREPLTHQVNTEHTKTR